MNFAIFGLGPAEIIVLAICAGVPIVALAIAVPLIVGASRRPKGGALEDEIRRLRETVDRLEDENGELRATVERLRGSKPPGDAITAP